MAGRLANTELVLPIIVGTVAVHLGKKVWKAELLSSTRSVPSLLVFHSRACLSPAVCLQQTDQKTHQWTVYVRSANGEDISHIVNKVRSLSTTQPFPHTAEVAAEV